MINYRISYLGDKDKPNLLRAATVFESNGQTGLSYMGKYCKNWLEGPYNEDFVQLIKHISWLITIVRD